jgi:hypothetical protein
MRIAWIFLAGFIALPLGAQEKPRVSIAASAAWRENDEGSKAEPEIRNVEIAGDFNRTCGSVTVTADFRAANYIAEFSRHTKVVPMTRLSIDRTDVNLFRPNADLVGAASKSSIHAAVKAACDLIKKDWPTAPHELAPKPPRETHPTARPTALEQ